LVAAPFNLLAFVRGELLCYQSRKAMIAMIEAMRQIFY
jgi:hypothetical protein